MFDPTVPSRCDCQRPDCPARVLYGQRVRTITDPVSGVAFVHPRDVVECLNAAIGQVLDLEGPPAAVGLPLTITVGQFVAEWMSDPQQQVPAGYVFAPAPGELEPEVAALVHELERGQSRQLDEALERILDEG
jgi:hypothetical protein